MEGKLNVFQKGKLAYKCFLITHSLLSSFVYIDQSRRKEAKLLSHTWFVSRAIRHCSLYALRTYLPSKGVRAATQVSFKVALVEISKIRRNKDAVIP